MGDLKQELTNGAAGISYDLTNIRNLMSCLENVHDQLKVIHVAGTNGKGSVCACICRILQEAGYRTGLYSSPAVFSDTEIIKINGRQISVQDFTKILSTVQKACAQMEAEGLGHPSAFEIETAAAFTYFYQEKCDFVVLEAGMGGARDATNIITHPVCCVFTSISRDHMAFLGETLREIAEAKAGIIKPGCLCVTVQQEPVVYEVLKHAAVRNGSELWTAWDELAENYVYDESACRFLLEKDFLNSGFLRQKNQAVPQMQLIHCGLTGAWQRRNIACALTVVWLLLKQGVFASGLISMKTVERGLSSVYLPGRFEQIHDRPVFYIDGAHNEGAALSLKETVQNCFTNKRLVYIIGVLADKEYEKVLRILAPYAVRIFTITPDHPRALDGRKLAQTAERYHRDVCWKPSLAQAVKQAADTAGSKGAVLAFGSFSYLGKLKQAVKDIL